MTLDENFSLSQKASNLPHVLLVDDDPIPLKTLELTLRSIYQVKVAPSVAIAKSILKNNPVDVVVSDLNFESQNEDGLVLMDWIAKYLPTVPIVVFSNDTKTKRVVGATRRNPINFLTKEDDNDFDLRAAIEKGLTQRKLALSNQKRGFQFHTDSVKVRKLLTEIDKIAFRGSSPSFLILGESGTGKEFIAKYIASRFHKVMISANMAALPKEMVESELFGHVKGAFTGAYSDKVGLIEQAHNGIFFLDELGDCPLPVQAKLLRVIQEGELRRVGDTKSKKISVQFIAATNKNLEKMIEREEFRLDLYQRLNTFTVQIPPLRERPEDLKLYMTQFMAELTKGRSISITASGLEALLNYSWPGNVRELHQFAERVATLCDTGELDASLVEEFLAKKSRATLDDSQNNRSKILNALEKSGGNRTHAARILGVDISTLYRKMNKLGIQNFFDGTPGRPQKN